MNIFKLDKNNINKIKDLYNDFKLKAITDYGFEFEPLEFENFKNTIFQNINKGYFSETNSNVDGFLIYTDKLNEAVELTLIFAKHKEIKEELLKTFLNDIKNTFKNKTISYPLLSKQSENEDLLIKFGFNFVKQEILEIQDLYTYTADLPKGYELCSWHDEFAQKAAKILQENFSKLSDAKFDPRFLTFIGCKKIIELITKGILGKFLPDITSVLLYKNEPIGFCFINLSNTETANIPILVLSNTHHGKKLGEKTVKSSVSKLFSQNISVKKINVTCDGDNISAIKTYLNSGFTKSEEYKHFYLKI